MAQGSVFTGYQKFIIAVLSFLQFTVILDFMVLSPLGAILLPELQITTVQFGMVVSAYAFSAGIAGLLAAGFADRFDRKKLLIFFYVGFLVGTALCATANTYTFLLLARIVTGVFGGVIGSVSFAIITDLFAVQTRGRVMGFVQMSFAAAQVLGLPIGVFLATHFGWHSTFWMIVIIGILAGMIIVWKMNPVAAHLEEGSQQHPFLHLYKTVSNTDYLKVFISTTLLATGGFMLMPFGSAFSTNNLGIHIDDLWILYGFTGIVAIFFGPRIGKWSDTLGRLPVFLGGTVLSMILVVIITRLGVTPFWIVIVLNAILFIGINARMISSSALITVIPAPKDRGAFMSINSSVQQVSGGIASMVAGLIVYQRADGFIENYPMLGMVVTGSMVISAALMFVINSLAMKRMKEGASIPTVAGPPVSEKAGVARAQP